MGVVASAPVDKGCMPPFQGTRCELVSLVQPLNGQITALAKQV